MPIEFLGQLKRQRYLILVLTIIVLITVSIIWRGFFIKPSKILPTKEVLKPFKKVEIDFEVLRNPVLEKLQLFEGFPPLGPELEIGRENPFTPY